NVLSNVMLQIDIRHMDRVKYESVAMNLLNATGLGGFEKKAAIRVVRRNAAAGLHLSCARARSQYVVDGRAFWRTRRAHARADCDGHPAALDGYPQDRLAHHSQHPGSRLAGGPRRGDGTAAGTHR